MKIAIYYDNGDVEQKDVLACFFHGEPKYKDAEKKYPDADGFVYRDNGRYYFENWCTTVYLGNYVGALDFIEGMKIFGFTCVFV